MLTHRNLLMACFAALLALGLAACGTGGNGPGPTTDDEDDQAMMPVTPEPDPEPTPLEVAQAAAQAAADAAGVAATAAETDAGKAAAAAMYLVGIQTAANLSTHAYDAHTHAGLSRADAIKAQTAATEAKDATDLFVAYKAQLDAEAFQKSAEDHRGHVTDFLDDAVAAAAKEVFVIKGGYKVGDTAIMTDAGEITRTVNDETTITGLLEDETPTVMVDAVVGVPFDANVAPEADVAYVQAVGAGTVDIGKVVDSPDDSARLLLITAYAGSKSVNVYTVADSPTQVTTMKEGYVTVDDRVADNGAGDNGADVDNMRLKAVGLFYLAVGTNDELGAADQVDPTSKPVVVYSYVSVVDNPDTADTDETVISYVVYAGKVEVEGDPTVYNYNPVDILAEAAENPETEGVVLTDDADHVRVYATIPEATDYKHINFGVWAALGEAAASTGAQTPSALGIGFVQSIGDGMTGDDMPNHGDATYKGNWAASVQVADDDGNGDVTLKTGNATLTADFGDDKITAMLAGLAMLEGDIDGNTFSGTDDATILEGDHGLDMTGEFEGEFNGAFFGSQAAEAGGVFAFATKDNEGGAFAGAFGGDKQPEDN